MIDLVSVLLTLAGAVFFLAGTLGMLRLPDVYTRLHALTKADNLGLGLTVSGLLLQAGSVPVALKMLLIWLMALVASSAACYLVANSAFRGGLRPRQGRFCAKERS